MPFDGAEVMQGAGGKLYSRSGHITAEVTVLIPSAWKVTCRRIFDRVDGFIEYL